MANKKSSKARSGIRVGPQTESARYNKMVERVNKIDDVKALKKIIYNRNYRIRKAYEKAHPEYAQHKGILQFPPIEDLRLVTEATFRRINKIKDPEKQVKELRKLIIDTTRRRNKPKTTGDFSNREQDYLENAVESLKEALSKWQNPKLMDKLDQVLNQITVVDIHNIFESVPSYWAISEGYYYAVTDFDNFMEEIYNLIERGGVFLTEREKDRLADQLFRNDPREG